MSKFFKSLLLLLSAGLFATTGWAAEPIATWTFENDEIVASSEDHTLDLGSNSVTGDFVQIGTTGLTITPQSALQNLTLIALVSNVETPTADASFAGFKSGSYNIRLQYTGSSITAKFDSDSRTFGGTQAWPNTADYTMIAITYDRANNGTRMYVNGATTMTTNGLRWSSNTTASLIVGSDGRSDAIPMAGMKVHQIKLYNSELTATDVLSDYVAWAATQATDVATAISGATSWSTASWAPSKPVNNASNVTLTVSGEQTLTMDESASVISLTVDGAADSENALTIAKTESNKLTAATTTISTDTTVEAGAASLGTVTVASGKILTVNDQALTSASGSGKLVKTGTIGVDDLTLSIPNNTTNVLSKYDIQSGKLTISAEDFLRNNWADGKPSFTVAGSAHLVWDSHDIIGWGRANTVTIAEISGILEKTRDANETFSGRLLLKDGGELRLSASNDKFMLHNSAIIAVDADATAKITGNRLKMNNGTPEINVGENATLSGETLVELGTTTKKTGAGTWVQKKVISGSGALTIEGGTLRLDVNKGNDAANYTQALPEGKVVTVNQNGIFELYNGYGYFATTGAGLTKVTGDFYYGISGGSATNTIGTALEVTSGSTLRFRNWREDYQLAPSALRLDGTIVSEGYSDPGIKNFVVAPTMLSGSGSIGTNELPISLSLPENATLDTAYGAVTVSGTVTLPAALTVKITEEQDVAGSVTLLNAADVTIPDGMAVTVMVGETAGKKLYTVTHDAEADIVKLTIAERPVTDAVIATVPAGGTLTFAGALGDYALAANATLIIDFGSEGGEVGTFTFNNENEEAITLTSITVTGTNGGTIVMADGAEIAYGTLVLNTTVAADAAFYAANTGAIEGTGKLCLASGELTLDEANAYTGGTEIAAGAKLTITNAGAIGTGAITGAGTLVCDGVLPTNTNAMNLTDSTNWTGTVWVKDLTWSSKTPFPINDYASNKSTLCLDSVTGTESYISPGTNGSSYPINICLKNNGWKSQNGNSGAKLTFSGALSGDGILDLTHSTPSSGQMYMFTGEISEFGGTVKVNANQIVAFGEVTSSYTSSKSEGQRWTVGESISPEGRILIAKLVTIAQGKIWTAKNGVMVLSTGTISGSGTIDSALTLANGATIDTTAGAVKVTGVVNLPSALTVKIATAPAVGTAVPLLNASNVTIPEGMTVTVMVGDTPAEGTYQLIKTPTALLLDHVPAASMDVIASTEALTESFTTLGDASGKGIQVDLDAATPYAPGWVWGQSYALKSLFLKKRSDSANPADAETTVSVVDVDNTSVVIATSTSCETTDEGYLFTFADAPILDVSKTYQFRTSKKVGIRGVSVAEDQSASLYLDENLAIVIPNYVPLYTLTAERIVDNSPILSGGAETLPVDAVPEKIRLNTATFGYGTHTVLQYTGDGTPDWTQMQVEGLPEGAEIIKTDTTWGFAIKTLNVLTVGDSITAGLVTYHNSSANWHVPGGYRLPLYKYLTRAGYTVKYLGASDEFGTYSGGNNPSEANPSPSLGENDHHEGHSGTTLDEAYSRFGQATAQQVIASQGTPDVITLHLGTNDMQYQAQNTDDSVGNQFDEMKKLIYRLNGVCDTSATDDWKAEIGTPLYPNATIFVAKIIPRGDEANQAKVDKFNKLLEPYVTGCNSGKLILVTLPMGEGTSYGYYRHDYLHPSTEGYTQMAKGWLEAIDTKFDPFGETTAAPTPVDSTPTTDVTEEDPATIGIRNSTANTIGPFKAAEWTTFTDFETGYLSQFGYMPDAERPWQLDVSDENAPKVKVTDDGVLSLNGAPITVNPVDGRLGTTLSTYTIVMKVSDLAENDVIFTDSSVECTDWPSAKGTTNADLGKLTVVDADTLAWSYKESAATEITLEGANLTDTTPDVIAITVDNNQCKVAVNGGTPVTVTQDSAIGETYRGSWSIGAMSEAETGSSMKLYRLSFYEGAATVVMSKTTATIDVGTGDNQYITWTAAKEALGLEDAMTSVTINFTAADQTFTFDEAVTIDAVTVQGEAGTILKDGDATVTVATTTVDANVTINAGVATLGAVTINAERTLTIKENLTEAFVTSLTNNGTLRFEGGTDEAPLEYAYAKVTTSKVKIAADSVVKCGVTGNHRHTVEGENAKTSIWRPTRDSGYGFSANTTLTCLTLDPRCGNASQGVWFEDGRITANNVILHMAESNIAYLRCDMTFSGLSGAGKVNAAEEHTLTLNVPAGTEVTFSGSLGQGQSNGPTANSPNGTTAVALNVVVTGEGAQTLAGTHHSTGTLTVSENTVLNLGSAWASGAVAVTGELALTNDVTIGGLSGAGTISIPSAKALTYASTAESTFSGTIAGEGGLTVSSGTLALTGTNTYNGATTIAQGAMLKISGADIFAANGAPTAAITVNGELYIDGDSTSFYRVVNGEGKITIPAGKTLALGAPWTYKTNPAGLYGFTGELEIAGTFDARSWSGADTTYDLTGFDVVLDGGTINCTAGGGNSSNLASAILTIAMDKALSGPGTINIPLTLADGATIDATNGVVTANTIAALPTSLKVVLPDAAEMPFTLLNTTTFEDNEGEVKGVTLTVNGEQTGDYLLNKTATALTLAVAPWTTVTEVTAEGDVDSWSELLAAMAANRQRFDTSEGKTPSLIIDFGDKPQDGDAVPGTFTFDLDDATALSLTKVTIQGTNGGTIQKSGTANVTATATAVNTNVEIAANAMLLGETTLANGCILTVNDSNALGEATNFSAGEGSTVKLVNVDNSNLNLGKLTNAAGTSNLILNNVKAYIYDCKINTLTLEGNFQMNNGTSEQPKTQCVTINTLTGSGALIGPDKAPYCTAYNVKAVENFTGAIDLSHTNAKNTIFFFGVAPDRFTTSITEGNVEANDGDFTAEDFGTLYTNIALTVPAGKTWVAKGVVVEAGGSLAIAGWCDPGSRLVQNSSGVATVENGGVLDLRALNDLSGINATVKAGGRILVKSGATVPDTIVFETDAILGICPASVDDIGSATLTVTAEGTAKSKATKKGYKTDGVTELGNWTDKDDDTTDNTLSFGYDPIFDGELCWWAYEFDNEVNTTNESNLGPISTGRDKTRMTFDGRGNSNRHCEGNEYVVTSEENEVPVTKAIRLASGAYRSATWPKAGFTAAAYGRLTPNYNRVLFAFGQTNSKNPTIALVTGASANAVQLVLIAGRDDTTTPWTPDTTDPYDSPITVLAETTVPNATTENHLFAFSYELKDTNDDDTKDATEIVFYVDGDKYQPYKVNKVLTIGGGFQMGTTFGGVPDQYLTRMNEGDAAATIEFLRVYDEVLPEETFTAMANTYPYISKVGRATRTITGTTNDSTWHESSGDPLTGEWSQTTARKNGEDYVYENGALVFDTANVEKPTFGTIETPEVGTQVFLNVDGANTLYLNEFYSTTTDAGTGNVTTNGTSKLYYERLEINGVAGGAENDSLTMWAGRENPAVAEEYKNSQSAVLTVLGYTKINTNVTLPHNVAYLSGPVAVAEGKTLTFDFSKFDVMKVPEMPVEYRLTGFLDEETRERVKHNYPDAHMTVNARSVDLGYKTDVNQYVFRVDRYPVTAVFAEEDPVDPITSVNTETAIDFNELLYIWQNQINGKEMDWDAQATLKGGSTITENTLAKFAADGEFDVNTDKVTVTLAAPVTRELTLAEAALSKETTPAGQDTEAVVEPMLGEQQLIIGNNVIVNYTGTAATLARTLNEASAETTGVIRTAGFTVDAWRANLSVTGGALAGVGKISGKVTFEAGATLDASAATAEACLSAKDADLTNLKAITVKYAAAAGKTLKVLDLPAGHTAKSLIGCTVTAVNDEGETVDTWTETGATATLVVVRADGLYVTGRPVVKAGETEVENNDLTLPLARRAAELSATSVSLTGVVNTAGDEVNAPVAEAAEVFTNVAFDMTETPDANGAVEAKLKYDFGVNKIGVVTIDSVQYVVAELVVSNHSDLDQNTAGYADGTTIDVSVTLNDLEQVVTVEAAADMTGATVAPAAELPASTRYIRFRMPGDNGTFEIKARAKKEVQQQ